MLIIESMQNNATQHIINRFNEKIIHTTEYKRLYLIDNLNTLSLNSDDFNTIWDICKDDSKGFNLSSTINVRNKIRGYRKVIFYKELPMWVVFTSKQKKPKTIYPVKKNILRRISKCQ